MKPFRVLSADPPWQFGDKLPGPKRGASSHYSTLTVQQICDFKIPPMAENSWLFLWRVASMQEEALQVAQAWGFTQKSEIVWIKLTRSGAPYRGMGRYVRNAHEVALICRRGRVQPADRSIGSVIMTMRGRHSQKPEAFYHLVEKLTGGGPFAELFARRQRPGWSCFGDQANP